MNADDLIGAVWSPDDGRVGPSDLCAALAKGARARGARIFEHTPVTGIETRAGRVHGVVTPSGKIRCDAIALCTGLWSRRIAALAGVDAPVWPCEHFYLLTNPVDGINGNLPTLSDHDSHLYIRDDSGGLLVGCFEPMGKPLDPERLGEDFAFQLLPEDWDHFEPMLENALHRLPCLADADVRMLLNGPESFTPDGSFLLGEAAETRGFFLGCGMNSVGVATGGGAGMALAHAIVHGHMPAALSEADPQRFPDCFNSVAALSERIPEILGTHYAIHYPGFQLATARGLRTTPLHAEWRDRDAFFGQVYGWERPLVFGVTEAPRLTLGKSDWFDRVGDEVRRAHDDAAVFDLSTFGKIRVRGSDAKTLLDRVCANDMRRAPGRAIYTPMLTPRGGYLSDLTAVRLADDDYRLYVGTGAVKRDLAWLRRHVEDGMRVEIGDETERYAVFGLMGPRAVQVVTHLGGDALLDLGYFRHCRARLAGVDVDALRLSYVGEAGWELTCAAGDAITLWQALAAESVAPAGVFAMTSMRIEKRFLALGPDLDADVDPLTAGLDFALDWNGDFNGKEALTARRNSPIAKCFVTIRFAELDATPLGNEPVYADGEIVGKTTSAAFGYRVGAPLALALIDAAAARDGAAVDVDLARSENAGTILLNPAFDPDGSRMRTRPG